MPTVRALNIPNIQLQLTQAVDLAISDHHSHIPKPLVDLITAYAKPPILIAVGGFTPDSIPESPSEDERLSVEWWCPVLSREWFVMPRSSFKAHEVYGATIKDQALFAVTSSGVLKTELSRVETNPDQKGEEGTCFWFLLFLSLPL